MEVVSLGFARTMYFLLNFSSSLLLALSEQEAE
jgi:hypothetical protein